MSLSAAIRVSISAKQTKTADLESAVSTISDAFSASFTDGSGANQADRIWKDMRTLAASTEENIDLAGVLTDIFGASVVFARIKAIFIKAEATNLNNVIVGSSDTNGVPQFFDAVIRPGGMAMWVAPDATGEVISAGSADRINFANSAGSSSVTYTVLVIGAST